jgi:hypothetical protein
MSDLLKGKEFVDNFLAHYASENYDPAQAHQYYEENKKLKGDGARGPKLTPEQRAAKAAERKNQSAARSQATKQISAKRQAELEGARVAQNARVEALRTNLEQRSAQIKQKLEEALAKLKVDAQKAFKPVQLKSIPENATAKEREAIVKQNSKLLEAARQTKLNSDKNIADASTVARRASQDEVKKLGSEIKATIAKAREEYAQGRQQTVAKYKSAAVTERANIRTQVQ